MLTAVVFKQVHMEHIQMMYESKSLGIINYRNYVINLSLQSMVSMTATSLLHSRKSSYIFESNRSPKSGLNYLIVGNQVLSCWSKGESLPDLDSLTFSPINSTTSLPKFLLHTVMQITLIHCFSLSSICLLSVEKLSVTGLVILPAMS